MSTYPSGAPMPPYGPSTNTEFITDALEWSVAMMIARDQMNAAVHKKMVRYSPLTTQLRTALALWRSLLNVETADEPYVKPQAIDKPPMVGDGDEL